MERKVIVIPKAEPLQTDSSGTVRKKRVCAYARVSTDFEDQKNSFNAQLDEFKKLDSICSNVVTIDAGKSVDEMVEQAIDVIFEKFLSKI